jgi:uncharacterized protein (DUF433 family)
VNTKQIVFPADVPLEYRDRSIRVIGSRITLDTLVGVFKRGETVEELTEAFPSLSLDQIRAVIGWYLTHQREADEYLEEREAQAEKLRQEIESQPGYVSLREKLQRWREQVIKT